MFEQNVLELENDPDNIDAIDEMFRAAHTLKGGSSTVDMNEIAQFTHLVENVLEEMRNGDLEPSGEVIDILLNSVDIMKKMLRERLNGVIFSEDISGTINKLNSFLAKEKKKEKTSTKKADQGITQSDSAGKGLTEYELMELIDKVSKDKNLYKIHVSFNKDAVINTVGSIQLYAAFNEIGNVIQSIPEFELLYDDGIKNILKVIL